MTDYDLVIGLEVHVQLKTSSKMFCACSAEYFGAAPNSHVCPVCLGLPGALPVANEEAVKKAIQTGIALNCEVPEFAKFDRKNYFYPDLAKGFQISQYDRPFSTNGYLIVDGKKIRINRAHLEEDTGKLIHGDIDGQRVSLVDFNRSGVPLLEIVSEPDISSPEEARQYAQKLNLLMRSIGVAAGDMEKAGMRFDANVSLKRKGDKELGTKVEIKNINSFRFLEKAIYYEYGRQAELLEKGENIVQETRGWVESKGITQSQRTKEFAPDYRYFPEPDLSNFIHSSEQIEVLKKQRPALPDDLVAEIVKTYALEEPTARILIEKEGVYQWFRDAVSAYQQTEKTGTDVNHIDSDKAVKVANWIAKDVLGFLKENEKELKDLGAVPAGLAEILYLIDQGKISVSQGRVVLKDYLVTGEGVSKIIASLDLTSAESLNLDEIATKIIQSNEKAVADYLAGKEQAIFFLVGQVVRETKGAANPEQAKQALIEQIKNARRT